MNCTATGVNLSFDKDNRLSNTLSRVSKADTNKRMVLAALLLNNDFKKYLLENITISDVLNGEIVDFDNFTENDYYKKFHFIEVMNCKGGCIGGGGQPLCAIPKLEEIKKKRKH